ncbi:hypothetical protein BGZ60DRAFT_409008 [Tricladium varicosporioides]|nr:hypothetical protein BGZ60DRAFT_409008 [Hymenoscyphus varicosporioides]
MGSLYNQDHLRGSSSANLHLSLPTESETFTIWTNTAASWKDSLTLPEYLRESAFLTTIPLARNGGMTTWILVDKNLPPNQRSILCSCETFRKRALIADGDGRVSDAIVHGIASVFCPVEYRGSGYAARMMRELAMVLPGWQTEDKTYVGSILYSDIGKEYYAKLGWHPNPTNSHIVLQPSQLSIDPLLEHLRESDIEILCQQDELMIRKSLSNPGERISARVTIVPDLDHILWHISKENFTCGMLFGKIPAIKGAIAGNPGNRIWAIWTHRYYEKPGTGNHKNTLYILRLVIEADVPVTSPSFDQVKCLEAVLRAAQAEAAEWKLDQIELWDPVPIVQKMLAQSDIEYLLVERERDSIASAMWYGMVPTWINNERYAWC